MSNGLPDCSIGTKKLLEMHRCINELRIRNVYCDVTIKVKEEIIHAHGGILWAHSLYFRERLKGIKGGKVIEIIGLEPEVVQNCVEFMYTGEMEVSIANLDHIAEAAKLFGLSEAGEVCENALKRDMNVCNAMGIRKMAFRYSWHELAHQAETFMQENFLKLLASEVYLEYSKEEFVWLLEHKKFDYSVEETKIWHSVMKWTQHEQIDREAHFLDVLKLVTLDNLSVAFMNDMIGRDQTLMRSQDCMKYLLRHLFSRLTADGALQHSEDSQPELG